MVVQLKRSYQNITYFTENVKVSLLFLVSPEIGFGCHRNRHQIFQAHPSKQLVLLKHHIWGSLKKILTFCDLCGLHFISPVTLSKHLFKMSFRTLILTLELGITRL